MVDSLTISPATRRPIALENIVMSGMSIRKKLDPIIFESVANIFDSGEMSIANNAVHKEIGGYYASFGVNGITDDVSKFATEYANF